ncbi:MAG: hypothetical protein V4579_09695 [Pseudomonadota bacterium]
MKRLVPVALLALAACQQDDGSEPGAVTVDEARALDEAAQMIEGQAVPQPKTTSTSPVPTIT